MVPDVKGLAGVRTSELRVHPRARTGSLSPSPATTMKCSGSYKCKCTEFQGARKAKRCTDCRHDRNSHYDPGSNDSGSDHNSDHNSDSSNDNDSNDDTESNTARPSTGRKNKTIVSSLVADLLQSGEYSNVDIDAAKSEAKAGLTRRQVGPTIHRVMAAKADCTAQLGARQNAGKVLTPRLNVTLPPIKSVARVVKIVMFPHGKEVSLFAVIG